MSLRDKLYSENIYTLFKPQPAKVEGWGSDDPNFKAIIDELQPKRILEVGSWLGASAIHMASLAPEAEIVCVDTWLGADEFWLATNDPSRDLRLKHGYPQVYYQFLSNVYHSGYKDRITPMPMPSVMAYRLLKGWGEVFDLVYIDASHKYEDVLQDLENFWELTRRGGIMFGDDFYTFDGVGRAVQDWGTKKGATPYVRERQWEFRK